MDETELKILDINVKEIEKKLKNLGSKRLGKHLITMIFFDFKDKNISKNNSILRLRRYGDIIELTHKTKRKNQGKFKVREETETRVDDFENTKQILNKLGLKCINTSEKIRTSYTLGKTKIELDQHPKIPAYIEIEGTKRNIKKIVKKLGFTMKDTSNLTSSEVLKKYGINPKNLRFKR